MLVYLDSAHFAYLERASLDEVAKFRSTWVAAGCELVMSLHHLQEMAQLSDETSSRRRIEVVRLFPVVRFNGATSALALSFEAQVHMITSIGRTMDVRRSAADTLFPVSCYGDIERALFALRPVLSTMRLPLEMSADAANLTKGQKRPSFRRRVPLDEQTRLEARALALEAVKGLPPNMARAVMELFTQMEAEVDATGSIRPALERMYQLDTVSIRSQVPDSDLSDVSVFFQIAREQCDEVAGRLAMPRDHVSEVVEILDPYACPGFALRLAVRRAREAHTKPDQASDEVDLDHLAFAPYVDLFFVDKRTLGFIRQETIKSAGRLDAAFSTNIAHAGSLAWLLQELSAFRGAV